LTHYFNAFLQDSQIDRVDGELVVACLGESLNFCVEAGRNVSDIPVYHFSKDLSAIDKKDTAS
jgi:hypothetical protein